MAQRQNNITRNYKSPEFARLSDFQLQELNEELKITTPAGRIEIYFLY